VGRERSSYVECVVEEEKWWKWLSEKEKEHNEKKEEGEKYDEGFSHYCLFAWLDHHLCVCFSNLCLFLRLEKPERFISLEVLEPCPHNLGTCCLPLAQRQIKEGGSGGG